MTNVSLSCFQSMAVTRIGYPGVHVMYHVVLDYSTESGSVMGRHMEG